MSNTRTNLVAYANRMNWIIAVIIVALLTFQYFRPSEVDVPQPSVVANSGKHAAHEPAAPAEEPARSRSKYAETQPVSPQSERVAPAVVPVATQTPAPPKVTPPSPSVVDPMANDRDGDGTVDGLDECPDKTELVHPSEYFADTDGDGFGDPNASMRSCTTTPPAGAAASKDDECPRNPNKSSAGECGCDCDYEGIDADEDGIIDCLQVGSNQKLNRNTPGWKPDYESAKSINELCANLKELAIEASTIRAELEKAGVTQRDMPDSITLEYYSAGLTIQLEKLQLMGAKLFQLQKEQFDRSRDPKHAPNAGGFALRLWPAVSIKKTTPVPVVSQYWLVIVQDLIATVDAIESMRGSFMSAAAQNVAKPNGVKSDRTLADWRKGIDRSFDDAKDQLRTTSKVLLDREKLVLELALTGGTP